MNFDLKNIMTREEQYEKMPNVPKNIKPMENNVNIPNNITPNNQELNTKYFDL